MTGGTERAQRRQTGLARLNDLLPGRYGLPFEP
jgi:hypothetical protein